MNPVIRKYFNTVSDTVTLETGRIARQANWCRFSQHRTMSQVLCTVVGEKKEKARPWTFFPLGCSLPLKKPTRSVKFPVVFSSVKARPSRKRNPDLSPDRSSYPSAVPQRFYMNEVQVVCTVISAEYRYVDPDIAAMIGTSAASGHFWFAF